jgi:DNA-binding beta-propeller fold protein YncE
MKRIVLAGLVICVMFGGPAVARGTTPPVLITTLDVGGNAYRVAIMPDGGTGLVTSASANAVIVIDVPSISVIDTIALPGSPNAGLELAITPNGNTALVTNYTDQEMIVLDIPSRAVRGSVPIGVSAGGLAIVPSGRTALVKSESTCGVDRHCLYWKDLITSGIGDHVNFGR